PQHRPTRRLPPNPHPPLRLGALRPPSISGDVPARTLLSSCRMGGAKAFRRAAPKLAGAAWEKADNTPQ
ncbi:MAG: hypothetical protein WBD53_11920, partial [Xanthobacteraceae bacterium]